MGFSFRKSIRVGPIRYNISGAGLGASIGVPGFRIGTGPRGTYVSAAKGGFRYVEYLDKPGRKAKRSSQSGTTQEPLSTGQKATAIDSGSALNMQESDSEDLLAQLNKAVTRSAVTPWVIVWLFFAMCGMPMLKLPYWAPLMLFCVGLGLVWWSRMHDEVLRTVPLLYELEAGSEFEKLCEALERLKCVEGRWNIHLSQGVQDPKYSAGASSLVSRTFADLQFGNPPGIAANFDVPILKAGAERLIFLPDQLLVLQGKRYGSISYRNVHASANVTQFIEEQVRPRDALRVGTTWRYVNKKGGPDLRFKYNPELPIYLYDVLHLTSASGLNELFHFSLPGSAESLARSLSDAANSRSN